MADLDLKDLKKVLDEGFEKQAVLINSAFQGHQEHIGKRFEIVDNRFESVDKQLDELKTDINRVEAKVDTS